MVNQYYDPSQDYEPHDSEWLVIRTGADNQIVYANSAFLKAIGYSMEELREYLPKILARDLPRQLMMDVAMARQQKRPLSSIVRFTRKSGTQIWLRINAAPLYADNKYMGNLLVLSKASREEIEEVGSLYKLMLSGQTQKYGYRQGRIVRLDFWRKMSERIPALGLTARLWGTLAALNAIGIGCILTTSDVARLSFWAAVGGLLTATTTAAWYLSYTVVAPLRDAVGYINQIAAADLSADLHSARSDEIGDILRGLAQVNINMRATVTDVREGMSVMEAAIAEIASGTQDLSSRTEIQASSLQQTSASMEEMNATVKNNDETAGQASALATQACGAADAGGQLVGKVVATMEGITQSSRKIADIIGVIDSIAFQTNILALNAAVEAARAGEQGRGFAVVAGEVRNLAQRSAQAAKEIKTLITESVDKVDSGSRLVDSAGKSIHNIVAQVRQVTELVGSIANASREQSAGIGQISRAVEQLDDMTQENAALVEEHTAAADSLKLQTGQLMKALTLFALSESVSTKRCA
jgi:aerotaxis receptor